MQTHSDILPGYREVHSLDPDKLGTVAESVLAVDLHRSSHVVVKRVHPYLQHMPYLGAALRGAALAAQGRSGPLPGLVRVLEVSPPDSSLAIVTDYVEGCSLREFVRQQRGQAGGLPWTYVFSLTQQIIEILRTHREQGLAFHGFIHPGNILLSQQFSETGQRLVLLDDWFLGRALQSYSRQRVIDKRKTLAGVILLGDLQYLSPEQCQESPEITGAADIYSLGILIYYLLSGQHPFDGHEAHDLGLAIQHLQATPIPLLERLPAIPKELSQLVEEMLHKSPGLRPSLEVLSERLRACEHALAAALPFVRERYIGWNGICTQHTGKDTQGHYVTISTTQISHCRDSHLRARDRMIASLNMLTNSNLAGYRKPLGHHNLEQDELYIISEHLAGGTLADMLITQNETSDPERLVRIAEIMRQVAAILRDTHQHSYVYLGLRPSAIWLAPAPDTAYRVLLLESETFRRGFSGEQTISGSDRPEDISPQSTRYAAPEQYYGAATPAADAYSLGFVLFQALNLRPPFATTDLSDLRRRGEPATPLIPAPHDPSVDPELATLTNQLLSAVPRLRPTLADAERRLGLIVARLRQTPRQAPSPPPPATDSRPPLPPRDRPEPAPRHTLPDPLTPPSQPGGARPGRTEEISPQDARLGDGRFPGFSIKCQLGDGGTSNVFQVVELATGQEYAIKEIKLSALRNAAALQRFHNELRFSQMVQHPGAIKCYRITHNSQDGSPWMLMEFIRGRTLRQVISDKRVLSPDEALQYGRWISDVLVSVHGKQLVHRDLKPENIMVPGDKRVDYPIRLIDFGIAKQAQLHQTAVGTVMGTLCYMPPEQCIDAGMVDSKADVFALGAILYEMLCGRQAQQESAVYSYISTKRYEPIPSLPANVQPAIARFVMRMLAFDPALRPTMEEAARTLRNLHRLALHGYGLWLVTSVAGYASQRLRQSALFLTATVLMLGMFAFGSYLAFAANQQQDTRRSLESIEQSFEQRDWSSVLWRTQQIMEGRVLRGEQRTHVQDRRRQAQAEMAAQGSLKLIKRATNYEDAQGYSHEIPAGSVYRAEADARLRALRQDRATALASAAKAAAAEHHCDAWGQGLEQLRKLNPKDGAAEQLSAAGCTPVERPTPSPPVPPKPSPAATVSVSQEVRMLQRAEEALAHGNVDDAFRQAASGLLNTLEGNERARRLVVRGKAACVLSLRQLATRQNNSQFSSDYSVAVDQLLQMGSTYERYYQDLTKYCQKPITNKRPGPPRAAN